MKVKFLSVIGFSLVASRDPSAVFIAKGLPTRQASAVLFYLRGPVRAR